MFSLNYTLQILHIKSSLQIRTLATNSFLHSLPYRTEPSSQPPVQNWTLFTASRTEMNPLHSLPYRTELSSQPPVQNWTLFTISRTELNPQMNPPGLSASHPNLRLLNCFKRFSVSANKPSSLTACFQRSCLASSLVPYRYNNGLPIVVISLGEKAFTGRCIETAVLLLLSCVRCREIVYGVVA
jgi:hypothetical protein